MKLLFSSIIEVVQLIVGAFIILVGCAPIIGVCVKLALVCLNSGAEGEMSAVEIAAAVVFALIGSGLAVWLVRAVIKKAGSTFNTVFFIATFPFGLIAKSGLALVDDSYRSLRKPTNT